VWVIGSRSASVGSRIDARDVTRLVEPTDAMRCMHVLLIISRVLLIGRPGFFVELSFSFSSARSLAR
jgi:hypothetical protein